MLNDISVSLHNFKDVERLHYKTNILAFWESQKHEKPDLYKLANIVLAVPSTQVYTIMIIGTMYFKYVQFFYFFHLFRLVSNVVLVELSLYCRIYVHPYRPNY